MKILLNRRFIVALFASSLAFNTAANSKYTLQDAYAQALLLAPRVQVKTLDEEAAEIRKSEALKRKRFDIDFTGYFQTASDRVQVSTDSLKLPAELLPAGKTILLTMPDNFFDFKLALKQPLYSGGALKRAVELAETERTIRRELTRNEQLELAGRLKTSYYTCLMLQKSSFSLQSLLEGLRLHRERVASLRREELLRESDLLEIRIRIAELKLRAIELENLLAIESAVFFSICGLKFEEMEETAREKEIPFELALSSLQDDHPLSSAFSSRLQALDLQRSIAASTSRPRLGAFAELHLARPGRNFFRDEWSLYTLMGLGLQMPLFNWGRTAAETRLATIETEKTIQLREEFFSEAKKALSQLFIHKEGLQSKMLVFSDLLADAAREVALKKTLYEEGQLDHRSYLAALLNREHYQARREEAGLQMEIVKAQILILAGKGLEEK